MYEMHVIISYQQVIFTDLINFYKFFNNMYFTHVILSLGSNVGRYSKMKSGYQRITLKLNVANFFLINNSTKTIRATPVNQINCKIWKSTHEIRLQSESKSCIQFGSTQNNPRIQATQVLRLIHEKNPVVSAPVSCVCCVVVAVGYYCSLSVCKQKVQTIMS